MNNEPSWTTSLIDRTDAAAEDHFPLRLWHRMLICTRSMEAYLRGRMRAEFDTTLARFDVLAQLEAAHGTLAMGELSARLMVTNGNVTGLIAGMEADGLVARLPHPTDRRSTLIDVTPAGQMLFNRMAPIHEKWVEALIAGLDRSEITQLIELLSHLKTSAHAADDL